MATDDVGYSFGKLWLPTLKDFMFDEDALVRIMSQMSAAQYFALTQVAGLGVKIEELLTQYCIIRMPELADELLTAMCYRRGGVEAYRFALKSYGLTAENRLKYK